MDQPGGHGGFWTRHAAYLEEIIVRMHEAWRYRIYSVHPDRGGSIEEAQYWNAVYAHGVKLFRFRGIEMPGSTPHTCFSPPVITPRSETNRSYAHTHCDAPSVVQ